MAYLARSLYARLHLAVSLLAGLALVTNAPAGQGGYAKQDFPRYGLEDLPVPKRWDPVPVQPTEKYVVLRWAEELPGEKSRREPRQMRPRLDVVSLKVVPDPEGVGKRTSSGKADPEKEQLPITSVERYLERQSRIEWTLTGDVETLKEDKGRERIVRRYLSDKNGLATSWVFEWRTPERVQFFLGRCATDDAEEMIDIWRSMATKVKLVERIEPDLSKWVRHYDKNPKFKDPEFRLAVRARLTEVKGWKAEDTENYLIVYSTKDKALIRILKRELEAIRKAYEGIFPPDRPLEAVSVLRVCKDRSEYMAYGGSAGSGGYWSPVAQELVFYDYEDEGQGGSGKANSRIVLYHEAFHQYVHYSAGDLAPHSWFNEGTGDFFSGARFDRAGKVSAVGPNPWRVEAVKYYMENSRTLSLNKLFKASKAEYYANSSVCYAQGWSLVYFLRTSKAVAKRPEWAKIHPTYYEALKEAWIPRRDRLAEQDVEPYTEVYLEEQQEAREEALEKALEGVEVYELQQAWAEFVHDLND